MSYYEDRCEALRLAETDLREHLLDTRAITDATATERGALAERAEAVATAAGAYAQVLRLVVVIQVPDVRDVTTSAWRLTTDKERGIIRSAVSATRRYLGTARAESHPGQRALVRMAGGDWIRTDELDAAAELLNSAAASPDPSLAAAWRIVRRSSQGEESEPGEDDKPGRADPDRDTGRDDR